MSRHVVVIGAGIVGACTALALLRDGQRVTLVEPEEPGGTQAASFGNGAWISPSSVVPVSMPGLWRKVPGYLLDPTGPLTIRPTALPQLAPWLLRFVRAGSTVARVEATARALRALIADAPARHVALAASIGQPGLVEQRGLIYAYPDRAAFEAEALAWRLRRDNGVRWTELDAAALRAREPALAPRYTFGLHIADGAHCTDPGGYVRALVEHAVALGGVLAHTNATGFELERGRLRAVRTARGPIGCDAAVLAAGIASAPLARAVGDVVPLASERGYHVAIRDPEAAPSTPVMPSDGKMANTVTAGALRAAGQVELANPGSPPDWRRADILLGHLLGTYPALAREPAAARVSRWMGHRPSTPDGLPVIGPSAASADIVHAFGHGHVGLAAAPITAQMVTDLLADRTGPVPPDRYGAQRFR